jgi:hypothetical protein
MNQISSWVPTPQKKNAQHSVPVRFGSGRAGRVESIDRASARVRERERARGARGTRYLFTRPSDRQPGVLRRATMASKTCSSGSNIREGKTKQINRKDQILHLGGQRGRFLTVFAGFCRFFVVLSALDANKNCYTNKTLPKVI